MDKKENKTIINNYYIVEMPKISKKEFNKQVRQTMSILKANGRLIGA